MRSSRTHVTLFLIASLLGVFSSNLRAECPSLPSGLVSWWQAEGDATDSADGNNGSLENGVSFVPGRDGQAFSFDGVNDFVDVPFSTNLDLQTEITLDAWIRTPATPTGVDVIHGKPDGYQLDTQPDGTIRFAFRVTGTATFQNLDSVSAIPPNVWTHVAASYESTTGVAKIYINGVLENTAVVSGTLQLLNAPLQIGGFGPPFSLGFFLGQLDEVRVFDRALTDAEIHTVFVARRDEDDDGDGFSECDGDCDDASPFTFPGAAELFDGLDNNCDGVADEGLDEDGDGIPNFNDACAATPAGSGVDPDGCAICVVDPDSDGDGFPASMDCNDGNAAINPSASESCNGVDDNCNAAVDEGFDIDGDGFTSCDSDGNPADCQDGDSAINPGAPELPGNAIDENCDGSLGACDPNATWNNHGEYVRCVSQEVEALVTAGVLTQGEGDALVQNAAQSDIGKGH